MSALRTGRCFTPQKHYFYASGTHFCWRLSKPQDLMRPEGLGNLIKIIRRTIHDNGTGWIWVVSFTSWPLNLKGSSLPYPWDTEPDGIRSLSRCSQKREVLPLPGIEPRSSLNISLVLQMYIPAAPSEACKQMRR
jgi:hypothetical protein